MTPPPVQRLAPDVVLLTGRPALHAVAYAVAVAQRARARNGLPPSRDLAALASAVGHTDAADTPTEQDVSHDEITCHDAARIIGCSPRQARRLAPRLGGRRNGGRWFLDAQAVHEHAGK